MVFKVKSLAENAVSGVIGAVAHRVMFGPQQMFVKGKLYNAALVNGVVIFAASVAASYVGPMLEKKLPVIPYPEPLMVGAATLGLSMVPLDDIPNPAVADSMSMVKTFALGAGSELAGEYAVNKLLPTLGLRIK